MKKAFLSLLSTLMLCPSVHADNAKPWTFWYWMNGAVTQEGVTADLEAMAEIGLEGCYLMPIYGVDQAPELNGTIRQGTPEWWKMVEFSMKEADRLGLKLGLHICDGFALAGGPWITPAQSMQRVVMTDTVLNITKKKLAYSDAWLPAAPSGYYQDLATYAVPLHYQPVSTDITPRIESPTEGFAIDSKGRIKCKEACSFTYTYPEPITVSALEITTYNNSLQALRMKVYYRDENNSYKLLKEIVPPRHGWQNYDCPTTVALPTVSTSQLKFEWTPEGTEKGSEDLDNGKWGKVLKIQEMKVMAEPRIDDWEGKAGRIWRVSSEQQSLTSASGYIPMDQFILLKPGTELLKGDYRIIRIGHASTLHENATGGDCKGLECDKFSRSATQSQLDHWFNAAFQNCDKALAKRVLKYMHVDSWECGTQNWSDSIPASNGTIQTFAQYFKSKRGYDLMPYLPLMVGIPMKDCATSERVLRDIRTSIGELVNDVFYPTLVSNAKRQGCQISAESVAPTMISDGMAHYKNVDFPMGEFWLNSPTHDKPNDMLDAISGGHVYGKQIIQAEGFTELRGLFNEVPAQLKPLLDKQYCLGINRLFFHVYALNPDPSKKPGMTLNGIGLFFQRTQPWWTEGRSFVDYITRTQRLLQMGRPVVDIAVYTGHEMPRRAILPERLAEIPGYHYDSFNYDALIHPVKSDYKPAYKVLSLPGQRPMDPDYIDLPDDALKAISASRLQVIRGKADLYWMNRLDIAPDAVLPEGILFAHRSLPESEIYFLSNQVDSSRTFPAKFRDHCNLPAVIYDPVTDTYQPGHFYDGEQMQITLPAYGSCFVLFGMIQGKPVAEAADQQHSTPLKATTPYQLFFEENGITLQSDTLPDWSKSESDSIRYYSGRVRYSFDFQYTAPKQDKGASAAKSTRRTFLRLTNLHDVATVILNGKPCGSVWTAPYEIEITEALQSGKNSIEIWVANSWNNAIIGHDAGKDPFANIWTNAKYRAPKPELLPAGLGEIELITK